MKYFLPFVCLLFSLQSIAQDTARPGPNNKIGHSKQSQEDKEDTFLYKLFNDELDFMGSSIKDSEKTSYIDNDKTLSQIEKLADLKERGIITDEEFQSKKSLLLNKIK